MPAKITSPLPVPAKPPITATGFQGFLLWFQREQPSLFAKVAPQLPAAAPKAFSGYNARMGRRIQNNLGATDFRRRRAPQIGELFAPSISELYIPISVDDSDVSEVNIPVVPDQSVTDAVNSGVNVGTIDPGPIPTVNSDGSVSSPVAAAANSGSTSASTPTANAISSVIGAAASVYMTSQQAALQQSAVSANLARAAAGLPPLNTSLSALGVPIVSTTSSTTELFIFGGLALAAVLLLTGGKKS
jgi:hypothetical protein